VARRRPCSELSAEQRTRTNWGGPKVALAAILAGGAALRLVGIQYGLPYGSLLNPDEQNVVPRAWSMTHGAGLDPHFFDWPTLVMYAVAPFQAWQATPSYLAGRFVVVAFAVAGIAAAWWLGSRSYGTVAGAIAAAATAVDVTHVTFSHAAVTDVPLTTLVTVALALLVTGRFELAGVAIGLATAAKYPGALTLVPLVVVAWGRWRRLAVSALLAAVAFFAASPFVVLDAGSTWSALRRIQEEHRRGWLGFEHDHWSGVAFAGHLWNGLGPVLVIAVGGLVVALVRRSSRADLVLGSFVVAYFASLLPLHSHFPRYVLPLVPALGALAGRFRSLAPVTLLLLIVPLTWSVQRDRKLTRTDTRIVAERWLAAHVPQGEPIAAESSTAVPPGHPVVSIPLPLPGKDARVDLGNARWILVSGAVADRVRTAQDVYPRRAAFYAQLPRPALRLDARDGMSGPWVAVYKR
jgi:4-amino-4-deoxy-L-arabinose transferase-like glycosyltransferase